MEVCVCVCDPPLLHYEILVGKTDPCELRKRRRSCPASQIKAPAKAKGQRGPERRDACD